MLSVTASLQLVNLAKLRGSAHLRGTCDSWSFSNGSVNSARKKLSS